MIHAPHLVAQEAAPAALPKGTPRPWWEGRPFVAAMILIAFVPLLWPEVPPLVDLPGHMGRFKVALSIDESPYLFQWYGYQWRPIGNIGVDAIVHLLAPLFGLEFATKLVVMSIPPLTVAGMLWVAREVHNRLPPTVAFALPMAFGHPFLYGFVNFSLSMALALLAFGLWLRLGRLNQTRLRAILFIPISFVVFFAHTFGWGTLGLLCFSAEAVRQHDRGCSWWRSAIHAGFHAACMALPILMIIGWRTEAIGGRTLSWFLWESKWEYLTRILRDRWEWWDLTSAAIVVLVAVIAAVLPKLTYSRNLAFSAMVLALAFVLLPRTIFGSAYADMRLVPFLGAILILAIRFKKESDVRLGRALATAGVIFLIARTLSVTASMAIADREQKEILAVLDHVEPGSRIQAFEWWPCKAWPLERAAHLPSMAIVRREAFSNDQWPLVGAALLTVKRPEAGYFARDPSQIVRSPGCRREGLSIQKSLELMPSEAFDYLWLINMPPLPAQWTSGWHPVISNRHATLLRRTPVDRP